jgi:hypothetical protein
MGFECGKFQRIANIDANCKGKEIRSVQKSCSNRKEGGI